MNFDSWTFFLFQFNLGGGPFFPQEMRPFNAQYRVYSMMCYSGDISMEKLHEMNTSGKGKRYFDEGKEKNRKRPFSFSFAAAKRVGLAK